ncbi:MAG: class I tRNA ligase family protein, partial [Eggerthellaceae bacterium]|nr:class I tRNA ligase family protein [Eggerthellaceae bacterium]
PFQKVIIHPTVMGTDGKPMSKSRGNGIDPVKLMQDYGADGMRFGLLMQVTGAQAMRFDYQKMESARNFANKIRNAARFVMMHLDGFEAGAPEPATDADKWMFSRLSDVLAQVDAAYDAFEFGELTRVLYAFVWNEFCDWYIEFSKSRLADDAPAEDRLRCQRNLIFVLDCILRMLHPIMPFLTEELYADLPVEKTAAHLIVTPWPEASALAGYRDMAAERAVDLACAVIGAIRSTRARYGVSPKTALRVSVKAPTEDVALIEGHSALIKALANVESLEVSADASKPAESSVILTAGVEVYVSLSGLVDFAAERVRLEKELAKDRADVERLAKKLSNPGFLAKAATEIVAKDTNRLNELTERVERLEAQIAELS